LRLPVEDPTVMTARRLEVSGDLIATAFDQLVIHG
jgi:hypothetical protein